MLTSSFSVVVVVVVMKKMMMISGGRSPQILQVTKIETGQYITTYYD